MVGFIISFRPLSRYIGLYHGGVLPNTGEKEGFPSPLEVYRFISREKVMNTYFIVGFRPLSRYIGLYHIRVVKDKFQPNMFPSPLEVYRFISGYRLFIMVDHENVSVPSRGI